MRAVLLALSPALVAVPIAACSKTENQSTSKQEQPPKPVEAPVTDPACAAKTTELEAWLAQLEAETKSYEINMGWTPVVLDRAPGAVTRDADYAVITPRQVSAWDHSEANHVGDNIGAGKDPKERLVKTFEMTGSKAADDLLRIDVDAAAPWGDVAKLVETAAQVGYKRVVFAFEGTSKLAQPAGVPAKIEDHGVVDEARRKIDEYRKVCSGWGYSAKETAQAIARCNCKVDPDEVRALMWKREKWHQARTRVGVELAIASDGTAIEHPASTPWSEAHAKLLDATGAVKLVAR